MQLARLFRHSSSSFVDYVHHVFVRNHLGEVFINLFLSRRKEVINDGRRAKEKEKKCINVGN